MGINVLAIDQGTTGTTTAVYDRAGTVVAKAYREFPQIYPRPGWVEHDPEEIWRTVVTTVEEVVARSGDEIAAVGITNQRETTVLWDRATGEPIHPAIVWQCRRTADLCRDLRPHEKKFRSRTGLPLDAYFSGTKIRWILDHAKPLDPDRIAFGTIDAWLIWKLTDGAVHATDGTNAARTLLYDIREHRWDPELCDLLGVPVSMLPRVHPSIDEYGEVTTIGALSGVPIRGVAGDQQAALFGQGCFAKGQMKNTYGTGCFPMLNTGDEAIASRHGLITTIAAAADGGSCYALEGSIFIAGAAIQWLRDELRILDDAAASEQAARSLDDNGGVYLVPAFVGLGAPHWDMEARGALVGLTRGSRREHVIRAALESMAYQTHDVLRVMEDEAGIEPEELSVDGGAVANDFLLQFQADVLGIPVLRPTVIESTSLGAAYLAGLGAGVWEGPDELSGLKSYDARFEPAMNGEARAGLLAGWERAVRQARTR